MHVRSDSITLSLYGMSLQSLVCAVYVQGGLGQLPGGFVSLDASRPWICYWVLHGLALLEAPLPRDISASEVSS